MLKIDAMQNEKDRTVGRGKPNRLRAGAALWRAADVGVRSHLKAEVGMKRAVHLRAGHPSPPTLSPRRGEGELPPPPSLFTQIQANRAKSWQIVFCLFTRWSYAEWKWNGGGIMWNYVEWRATKFRLFRDIPGYSGINIFSYEPTSITHAQTAQ